MIRKCCRCQKEFVLPVYYIASKGKQKEWENAVCDECFDKIVKEREDENDNL